MVIGSAPMTLLTSGWNFWYLTPLWRVGAYTMFVHEPSTRVETGPGLYASRRLSSVVGQWLPIHHPIPAPCVDQRSTARTDPVGWHCFAGLVTWWTVRCSQREHLLGETCCRREIEWNMKHVCFSDSIDVYHGISVSIIRAESHIEELYPGHIR